MDETLLFMDMTSTKTITKIRSKEVIIMTHGQERIHVTAILWIVANGTKIPPMFVFEGNLFRLVGKKSKAFFIKKKTIFFLHIV